MSTPQRPQLSQSLQFWPWPPGDPAPEIWRVILELDQKIQLQVVDAVLEVQLDIARAHIKGLETIRKAIPGGRA